MFKCIAQCRKAPVVFLFSIQCVDRAQQLIDDGVIRVQDLTPTTSLTGLPAALGLSIHRLPSSVPALQSKTSKNAVPSTAGFQLRAIARQ